MKHYLYLLIIVLISLFSPLASEDFSSIDEHTKTVPQDLTEDIRKLSAYLTKPAKTDREKVRALYYWIVHNIEYDLDALDDLMWEKKSVSKKLFLAESVLKNRKAVCGGFSLLFKSMAESVGLEAEVVLGWAKNVNAFYGDGNTNAVFGKKPNHAWNVVKVDGKWELLENTYGRVWGNGKDMKKEYDLYNPIVIEYFFLPPPEKLIETHYPRDTKWLLLDKKISKSEFDSSPQFFPGYFIHSLELVSPKSFQNQVNGEAEVKVKNFPRDKNYFGLLFRDTIMLPDMKLNKYEIVRFNSNEENEFTANLKFPKSGKYFFLIMVNHMKDGTLRSDHSILLRFNSKKNTLQKNTTR